MNNSPFKSLLTKEGKVLSLPFQERIEFLRPLKKISPSKSFDIERMSIKILV